MSTATKLIVLVAIMISLGLGLVVWKTTYGKTGPDFSVVTTAEMEAFLEGAGPEVQQRIESNPKEVEDQFTELFALAGAAKKQFKDDADVMRSLEIIEMLTWATAWDREKHKDAGEMPPFGFISQEQIDDFWGEGQSSTSAATVNFRKGVFESVAKTQFALAQKRGTVAKDAKLDEETMNALRPEYTKIKIYEEEARATVEADPQKWAQFKARVSIQAKLQQAQFLAGALNEELAKKLEVTDEEVSEYLAKNPGLGNKKEKISKAQELIRRLDGGADFAALAKEFSEDPGSAKDGGLIKDAALGTLVPEYEKAALALKEGEYTKTPIETQFGLHIIKLEKKQETKNEKGGSELKYDTRHILISTRITNPDDPLGMPMSAEEFAKSKIQEEKREKLLAGIKSKYPVTFEPYKVPKAPAARNPAPAAPPVQPQTQGEGKK